MIDSNGFSAFFFIARRTAASFPLLTILAAGASVVSPQRVGTAAATHSNTALIDPDGLELDGAGAAETAVILEATYPTLLMIWTTRGLGIVTLILADRRVTHKSIETPSELQRAVPKGELAPSLSGVSGGNL